MDPGIWTVKGGECRWWTRANTIQIGSEAAVLAYLLPKWQRGLRAQHQFLPHVWSVLYVGATRRFRERSERRLTKYEFHELNRRW